MRQKNDRKGTFLPSLPFLLPCNIGLSKLIMVMASTMNALNFFFVLNFLNGKNICIVKKFLQQLGERTTVQALLLLLQVVRTTLTTGGPIQYFYILATPMSQCPLGTSWTLWFDRDDPYGRCDCETLGDLRRENRGRICERPVGIEARNSHTKQLYTGNRQNIKISPTLGFTCWNTRNYRCRDHEVRFCCPTSKILL